MLLVDKLVDAGLLQFGSFDGAPYILRLDLLPSYPTILAQITEMALQQLPQLERLVCLPDSMVFGVGMSLKTGVPLVYSQGSDLPAAFDLVGAYDTGHPAVLLMNVWLGDDNKIDNLTSKAARVGLNINSKLAIVDASTTSENLLSLVSLVDATNYLVEQGRLPQGQANAVLDYIG